MGKLVHKKMGKWDVFISIEEGKYHLSISSPDAAPTYDDIKKARYKFLPDNVTMAQIFPPKSEFINLHPHCHHLWQID